MPGKEKILGVGNAAENKITQIDSPKIAACTVTSFKESLNSKGLPIKLYMWESFLDLPIKTNSEAEKNYIVSQIPRAVQQLHSFLSFFSNQYWFEEAHDVGFAFLYGYMNKVPIRVVGADLLLFEKKKEWKDNPMVRSWTFEIAPYAESSPRSLRREEGIMRNAELRIAGLEALLRLVTSSPEEYIKRSVVLPPELLRD